MYCGKKRLSSPFVDYIRTQGWAVYILMMRERESALLPLLAEINLIPVVFTNRYLEKSRSEATH